MIYSFPPLIDKDCRILILGSMPGVASLTANRYYAHPRNGFWRILHGLFGGFPDDFPGRYERLLSLHIALWDVLQSCEREGSLDGNIKNGMPNDIETLLAQAPRIQKVFCNGGAAASLYKKHFSHLGLEVVRLPSSSPAAAQMSEKQKLQAWSVIKEALHHENG